MRLWRAWERYWFRSAPLFDLGFVRLIAVGFQLYHLATIQPRSLFGQLAALPDFLYAPLAVLRVLTLPFGWRYRPPEDVIMGVYWLTLVVGVLAFVGYRTTISLVFFTAGNVFMQAFEYSFNEIHHAEAIVMITLAVLALSPAGGAVSVDDLLRRLRDVNRGLRVPGDPLSGESRFARWPLLVVQWMFALIYLSAAYHKLTSSGLDWMNGWTLQYYVLQDAMRWGSNVSGIGSGHSPDPGVGLWIGQYHTIATVMSWGSILFEMTFWVVLVIPRLAPLYLSIGAGFHLAVYVLQRAPFLSFVWLYAVFVPWSEVFRRAGAWLVRRTSRPVLCYDPASPRSVRRATLIRYFDWLGIIVLAAGSPPAARIATVSPSR
jgi:hypothetical protein